jgi:tetratricopeptide (TPR) repeat protein
LLITYNSRSPLWVSDGPSQTSLAAQSYGSLIPTLLRERPGDAIAHLERAIELNPNSSDWRVPGVLIFVGQAERAVDVAKTNLRVDPFAPPIARGYLGLAYLTLRRYSEAIPPPQEFVARAPKQRLGHVW